MMKNRDVGQAVSSEIEIIKRIKLDTPALKSFWDNRYNETYNDVLENNNEIGRHGIIAEYINRIIKKGDILDIGCGTGILAELLDMKLFNYLGIDLSKEALKKATEKLPALKMNFKNIRFEEFTSNKIYDVIVCNEVIYYMDLKILLQKCIKLLDKNGHFIVSVFDFKEGKKLLPVIKAKLESPYEITIFNSGINFKWYLLAGKFKR